MADIKILLQVGIVSIPKKNDPPDSRFDANTYCTITQDPPALVIQNNETTVNLGDNVDWFASYPDDFTPVVINITDIIWYNKEATLKDPDPVNDPVFMDIITRAQIPESCGTGVGGVAGTVTDVPATYTIWFEVNGVKCSYDPKIHVTTGG